MEDAWEDLVVEDVEQQQIDNQPDFKKFLAENQESAQKILNDVKIRAVKKVMNDVLSRISLPVKQINKRGMIGYCLGDYPFFIIEFTNSDQINLLITLPTLIDKDKSIQGIMKPLKGKKLKKMEDSITWKGKFTNFRFYSIVLESIGEVGGAQILKRLVNQSVRYVENTGYYMSQFLSGLGQSLNYDDLFSRIYLTDKRVKGIVRNELQAMLKIQAIWMFKPQKYLNLVAERVQGMAQELHELGYKKTGQFNTNGKWEDSGSKTKYVRLYYKEKSDNSDQEMTDLMKKFLFDIAKASSIVAYKDLKKNKAYFEELLLLMENAEGLDDSFHYRLEDNGIVFYKGNEMPLYQKGAEYFCFEEKAQSTNLKFRFMEKQLYSKLGEAVQVNLNDYWLYHVKYDESIKDAIDEALRSAILNSGNGKQRVSHDWLLACIKESKIQNLDKILKSTLTSDGWVEYGVIDSNLKMTGLTTVWNKRNLKHFLEYDNNYLNEDGTKGRVQLSSRRDLVKSVLDDLGS